MRALPLFAALILSACSSPEVLIPAPQVSVVERIPTRFASVEVLEESLPAYAASAEIALADGLSLTPSGTLWADDPTRAVTLALARNLKEATGARVTPEPWPFDEFPAAQVDVRVEDLRVVEGALKLSGQYFVADLEGRGRDHAHLFSLETPLLEESPAAAAAGRAVLFAELARLIAQDGL